MKQNHRLLPFFACLAIMAGACLLWGCSGRSRNEAPTAAETDIGGKIEAYVTRHQNTTAGLAVAVYGAREVLYEGLFGYADREGRIPVTEETVFEWGPVTRLLVWVSVMQQVEAGKLDLKADIRDYLPTGFLSNAMDGQQITMEHLMNHTAGFQEKIAGLFAGPEEEVPSLAEALSDHPPVQVAEAGELTAASSWGTALAGYIVERVTGLSFGDYVQEAIFRPLGMKHTAILPDYSDCSFVQENRGGTVCYTVHNQKIKKSRYRIPLYPAGMCAGTVGDLVTFAQALLPNSRTARLFADNNMLSVLCLPTDLYSDGTPKNSHGFWNFYLGTRVVGETGSTVGMTATLLFDPEKERGVCVMTNQAEETVYNRDMMELVFGSAAGTSYEKQEKLPGGRYRSARGLSRGALLFTQARPKKLKKTDLTSGYWVASRMKDGRTILEQPYKDYVSVPAGTWFPEWLRMVWFAVSAAGCVIYLIRGIAWQTEIRRGRRRERPDMVWYLILLEGLGDLLVIGLVLNMAAIVRRLGRYAPAGAFGPLLLINSVNLGLLAVLMVSTLLIFLLGKRRKVSHERIPAFFIREFLWLGALVSGCCWQMAAFWNW